MALESLGFTDKEARDSKFRDLKTLGFHHVTKYSTYEPGSTKTTWVVSWDEPEKTIAQEEKCEESE